MSFKAEWVVSELKYISYIMNLKRVPHVFSLK